MPPRSGAEFEQRKRFSQTVLARDKRCVWADRPDHICSGRPDAHHLVKKQTIRAERINRHNKGKKGRWVVVYHPDNGIRVCRGLHDQLTSKAVHLRPQDVPDRAREWAMREGFEADLEREVPGLFLATLSTNR